MRLKPAFALAVTLSLLCACKSPRQKYESAARSALAELPKLSETATVATLEPGSEKSLAPAKLKLKYGASNGLLIHLDELKNPTLRRALPFRLNQRSPTVDAAAALGVTVNEPGAAVDTDYVLASEDSLDEVWQRLGELKYVLVVRTTARREAELRGGNTFASGTWSGEVLVFDWESRKLLGGFPVSGDNHSTVQTGKGDDQRNLAADLKLATRGNFNVRVRELFPSVGPNDEIN